MKKFKVKVSGLIEIDVKKKSDVAGAMKALLYEMGFSVNCENADYAKLINWLPMGDNETEILEEVKKNR